MTGLPPVADGASGERESACVCVCQVTGVFPRFSPTTCSSGEQIKARHLPAQADLRLRVRRPAADGRSTTAMNRETRTGMNTARPKRSLQARVVAHANPDPLAR